MVLLLGLLSILSKAQVQDSGYLQIMEPETQVMVLQNKHEMEVQIHLQFRDANSDFQSVRLHLAAYEIRKIPIMELSPTSHWIRLQGEREIEAYAELNSAGDTFKTSLVRDLTNQIEFKYERSQGLNGPRPLHLANLSSLPNLISIESESGVETLELAPFKAKTLDVESKNFRLSAAYPILSYMLDPQVTQTPQKYTPQVSSSEPPSHVASYFEFTSSNKRESFVITLNDPELIRQAREQLLNTSQKKILLAQIGPQVDGINRNLKSKYLHTWSWQTTKVYGFSDFSSIKCDGSPTQVELLLREWTFSPGRICFWSFQILREIPDSELFDETSPEN